MFFDLGVLLSGVGLVAVVRGALRRNIHPAVAGLGCFAVAGVLFMQPDPEFWAVDGCLDAGGRYNYEEQRCVYE